MSPRWLAWALGALTLGLIACAVVLALLNRYSLWDVTFLVAQASAALVDGLIASRRPRNPVGWFIIGHALCFTLGGVLAAVRDLRPSHQPHPGLRIAHGVVGSGVPRQRRGTSRVVPRADRARLSARGRRLHPGHSRAVQPAASPHTGLYR